MYFQDCTFQQVQVSSNVPWALNGDKGQEAGMRIMWSSNEQATHNVQCLPV